tara:strand:- start:2230 stop:2655 length:426 start_codon:yes stop_codon:yes gene_type:complete
MTGLNFNDMPNDIKRLIFDKNREGMKKTIQETKMKKKKLLKQMTEIFEEDCGFTPTDEIDEVVIDPDRWCDQGILEYLNREHIIAIVCQVCEEEVPKGEFHTMRECGGCEQMVCEDCGFTYWDGGLGCYVDEGECEFCREG